MANALVITRTPDLGSTESSVNAIRACVSTPAAWNAQVTESVIVRAIAARATKDGQVTIAPVVASMIYPP